MASITGLWIQEGQHLATAVCIAPYSANTIQLGVEKALQLKFKRIWNSWLVPAYKASVQSYVTADLHICEHEMHAGFWRIVKFVREASYQSRS